MRRIGHRGAKGHAPENTIESFAKALELGCDEVETDVWLAGDGRLLISHDRPGSDVKLTLQDVLDYCRGHMGVNVELKSVQSEKSAHDTGASVGRVLVDRRDPDVYVSSFWWSALEGTRNTAPSVRRAFLFADSPERGAFMESARGMRLWAIHPNRAYVTPDLVHAAHSAGLKVQAWTVNEPDEMARFAEWGIDGIMSDYPERVPKT
ncbi:MAG: glycerophosphodiester phosphodiesterase [Chloroflexi bacterium]|nr:MAG: glycerophosphodiester phosphodiesterase [Chloroflexota bacterium]